MISKFLFPFLLGLSFHGKIFIAGVSTEGRLLEDLLANYNKYTRPTLDPNEPTIITLEFGLRKIGSLDEQAQVLTTSGFIISFWMDPFLVWDPAKYNGTSHLIVPGDLIWLPELAVYNSAEGINDISLVEASKFRVDIQSNGMVLWIPGGQWKTECQVKLVAFPFDRQTCDVIFTNWMHKTAILYRMRTPGYIRLDGYSPNSEWALVKASSNVTIITYGEEGQDVFELPMASFSVELERSSGYYVLNVLVPSLTLSLISVLMFWLPPECGERISFGITVLLSFSFIMLMMSDVTPKSGTNMPLLLYYVVTCMLVSGMSLCLSVLIMHINIRTSIKPPSERVRTLVFSCLARLVCSSHATPARKTPSKNDVVPIVLNHDKSDADNNDVLLVEMKNKRTQKSSVERFLRRVEQRMDEDRTTAKNKEEWTKICEVLDHGLFILISAVEVIFTAVLLIMMALAAEP